jgi:hypothetical protein
MLANVPQVPVKTSNTASYKVPGVTAILWFGPVAVKENQMSSSAVPEHPTIDCVVPTVVAFTIDEHVLPAFTGTEVAPLQLSFVGSTATEEVREMLSSPIGGIVPRLVSLTHSKTSLKVIPA